MNSMRYNTQHNITHPLRTIFKAHLLANGENANTEQAMRRVGRCLLDDIDETFPEPRGLLVVRAIVLSL